MTQPPARTRTRTRTQLPCHPLRKVLALALALLALAAPVQAAGLDGSQLSALWGVPPRLSKGKRFPRPK